MWHGGRSASAGMICGTVSTPRAKVTTSANHCMAAVYGQCGTSPTGAFASDPTQADNAGGPGVPAVRLETG